MATPVVVEVTAGSAARAADERRPVVVVLGRPDKALTVGFRSVGLEPIAEDGDLVIWGPARPPSRPEPAPQNVGAAATPSNLLLTIRDAAQALGLGRSTVYELIGRGELEVVHVGRSARVPADAVRRFVDSLRSQDDGPWRKVG